MALTSYTDAEVVPKLLSNQPHEVSAVVEPSFHILPCVSMWRVCRTGYKLLSLLTTTSFPPKNTHRCNITSFIRDSTVHSYWFGLLLEWYHVCMCNRSWCTLGMSMLRQNRWRRNYRTHFAVVLSNRGYIQQC